MASSGPFSTASSSSSPPRRACVLTFTTLRRHRLFRAANADLLCQLLRRRSPLRFEWSILLLPFDDVLKVLSDSAAVQRVIAMVASTREHIEINPAYFAEAALNAVNVALGLLKLLAAYGAKAFATFDALRSDRVRRKGANEGESIVQVHGPCRRRAACSRRRPPSSSCAKSTGRPTRASRRRLSTAPTLGAHPGRCGGRWRAW